MTDRSDDVTEEVSSSQGQQTHEVGESSRPPQTEDEIFRTQLVTAVAMFTQVMQNPRFMALLQSPPPSQSIGNKKQKSEPSKAQSQVIHTAESMETPVHLPETMQSPNPVHNAQEQVAETPVLQAVPVQPATFQQPIVGSNGQGSDLQAVPLTEQIEKYCCGLPKGLRKYCTKTKVTNLTQLIEVWQLHVAEQALLDDEEYRAAGIVNPPQKLNEIPTAERFYVDPDSFWTEEELCDKKFLSLVLTQHEWELDMDCARKEREAVNKAREEAEKKGEEFEKPKPQRIKYIEELDIMNWQRYLDEHEAVQRDRVNRLEFGLPLEEPGKYADDSFFGENKYNPREKRWRKDYLGDYSKFKEQRTSQPRLNGNKFNEDGKSVNSQRKEGSEAVGGSGWTKDEDFVTNSFKENGEEKGNGEKLVNGTESSTVSNMNGLSRLTDEDNLGGETE
ncbi:hypothetical protein L7F22_038167 [Adiantum nelumboides]|nr:hypothetical protein [Adiantum nelumboides]